MLWPASAPECIGLPELPGGRPVGAEHDSHAGVPDEPIVGLEVSSPSFVLVAATATSIYVFRLKPLCAVAVLTRSEASVKSYGPNVELSIHPDGRHVSVSTSLGHLLVFELVSIGASEVCSFVRAKSHGEEATDQSVETGDHDEMDEEVIAVYPGPGEALGVRAATIRFVGHVKLAGPDVHIVALDGSTMVVYSDDSGQHASFASGFDDKSDSKPPQLLLSAPSKLAFLDSPVRHIASSKAMSLLSITTVSGAVYSATTVADSSPMSLSGHLVHSAAEDPAYLSGINARFSQIAVGTHSGAVYLYNIRDYSGTVKLVRIIEPPLAASGHILCLKWSLDGTALFVGFETGWKLHSVYGMTNASSFQTPSSSSHDSQLSMPEAPIDNRTAIGGVRHAAWSFAGDTVYMVPPTSAAIWAQGMLRWGAASSLVPDNLRHPVLVKDNKILVYHGHEQSDLTTIDRDALLWLTVAVAGNYAAECWPIKYVSSSSDGRYVAVAGLSGLAHYSIYSGRWKVIAAIDDHAHHGDFSVRGGLAWYGRFIVAAVECEGAVEKGESRHKRNIEYQIRVYSRDQADSGPDNMVMSTSLPSPVIRCTIVGDLLLVYCLDNNLYFYRFSSIGGQLRSLDLEAEVPLTGIVQSPARVRSIGGLARNQYDETSTVSAEVLSLILLVDGMLLILDPISGSIVSEGGTKGKGRCYRKHVLHNNIEFYMLTTLPKKHTGTSHGLLWAFDGKDMLFWLKDQTSPENRSEQPTVVPVEAYPLAILSDKGIIASIEADTILAREGSFSYFKFWASTQLFLPFVLEACLQSDSMSDTALAVATEFKHLKYFSHILEMLVYRIMVQSTGPSAKDPVLERACRLVLQFPQMLDVFLGCTRKTEVKYWPLLFDIVGSPQELFERCISTGKLKTAAGYLIVLHGLDKFSDDGTKDTARLFKMAYTRGDWELCKELSRFLALIDNSMGLLRRVLMEVDEVDEQGEIARVVETTG